MRFLTLLLGLSLSTPAFAVPPHTWHAETVPDSLLTIARDALARADYDKGYSEPYVSVVIEASDRDVTTHVTSVMAFGSLDAGYDNGNAYIAFDESSAKLSVNAAFVLLPDGSTQTVDHATVQSVSNDTDVFSDSVSLVVPLPGLEAHSVAVLDYTRRESLTNRVYPWGRVIRLQAGYPIDRFHIQLSWSPANELAWSTDAGKIMTCSETDHRVQCDAEHIDAIPRGETINYYDVVPEFSVAQRRTWEALHDTTLHVVAGAQSGSASVRDMAKALQQGTSTSDEFIARVHEFVARRIRYVGMEQGEHGYVPHKTADTLSRRFGDCKDKTALLIELLRAGGAQARPVLVGTDYTRSEKLLIPNQAYFDHMVACIDQTDGSVRCLDPTDAYTPWSEISSGLEGRVNLGMNHGRVAQFPRSEYLWQIKVATTNTISANGDLAEQQRREFVGTWASSMRSALRQRDKDDRKRFLTDGYREVIGDESSAPQFDVDELDSNDAPLVVRSQLDFPALVPADSALDYTEQLSWLRSYLRDFRVDNRTYPYEFDGFRYTGEVKFVVADHWRPNTGVGPTLHFQSRFGQVAQEITRQGQTVSVTTDIRLPSATIAPADLPAFKRFLSVIAEQTSIQLRGNLSANRVE